MAKPWFLDYMGKGLVPSRMEEACRCMGFDEKTTSLIMIRFAHGQGMGPAEQSGFSEFMQRKIMPDLDAKVLGWAEANPGFFQLSELRVITQYFDRLRRV